MDPYINPMPVGLNPVLPTDRKPVLRFYNGDSMVVRMPAALPDGRSLTPDNSKLTFVLADDQFQPVPLWEGVWRAGIELVEKMIVITVPAAVSASLNRGSYRFSLCVAGPTGADRATVLDGALLIEYAASSPNHDIPYKDLGWISRASDS